MNPNPGISERISFYFNMAVVPWLYNFAMWLFLSAAASIFMGDILNGTGLASAVSLYYITRGYYMAEMYNRSLINKLSQSVEDSHE